MKEKLFRTLGAAALGLALGWIAVATPAAAETKLNVGKANPNADNTIPVDVGFERGLFKQQGLDLTIVNFQGGSKMVQALIAGNIDIAVGAGVEMAFIQRGAPMMAVCESASTLPFMSVGLPWDSPVKSLAELKGKRMGVSSFGSLTDWLAKQLAVKQGWNVADNPRASIGGSPAATAAAFRADNIDADIAGTATFLTLAEHQDGRVLTPVSTYMGHVASGVIFASNALIASDPKAVRGFLAGWLDTIRFIRANKAEAVKLEMAATKYSANVMSQEYDFVVGMYTKDCRFDAESLATLKQSFIDLELLTEPPDMAKLYTHAYLPE